MRISAARFNVEYDKMVEQRPATSRGMVPIGPRAPAAAAAMTPKDMVAMLRRHVLLIVSITILGVIVSIVSWYLFLRFYPRYTASTFIKVLSPVEKDPTIIGGALATKEIQYGHRQSMANLIKQQRSLQTLLDNDKIQETQWFRHFGKIKAIRILKAMKNLEKHLGVFAHRDAEFVSVSMTCGDDEESALIVNTMVNLFVNSRGSATRKDVAEKLAGLRDQLSDVEVELAAAERGLDNVRRTSGFTDLEEHSYMDTLTSSLTNLESKENETALDISQLQANIKTLEEQAVGPISVQVEDMIERDPTVTRLTQRLADLEALLAGLLMRFGENHRVVLETQETVNELRSRREKRRNEIAEQTRRANLRNAQDGLVTLLRRLEESKTMRAGLMAKKAELDMARAQYQQREAIRDERRGTRDNLKTQLDKLKIMHDAPETPKVQTVGLAPVPLEVSFPKLKLFIPTGSVLGFMLGVGLSFLIELLNDLVRTPRDVGRYLHIPLLGVIPDADEDDLLEDVDLCHVVRQAPYSIVSESYRRFRTNLTLSSDLESKKVLLVSSGMAGEGKTTTAVNLATALVVENKKVILVDANFWQPSLSTIFPKTHGETVDEEQFGLSSVLTGLCSCEEIIRATGIDGFDIIDAGTLPSNPAELLSAEMMKQMIEQLRKNYDYVIIDGPPVLLVSATKSLARFVDTTVLVFNASTTHRGAAMRVIKELREVKAPIIGCLLFGVKSLKGGYFSEQFKSYQDYQKLQFAHSI